MRTGHYAFRVFVGVIVAVFLVSCGGGRRNATSPTSPSAAEGRGLPATIQTELDALSAPPGVDAQLFASLKEALAEVLSERFAAEPSLVALGGKVVATPPRGADNLVDDLMLTPVEAGWDLTWSYRNRGDYNQDGIVDIKDITPLAIHFQESVEGGAPIVEVIDGNGDGVVNIADITPLAVGFGVELADYAVEGTDVEGGGDEDFTETASVDLASSTGDGRKLLTYHLDSLDYQFFRVVPRDSSGERGDPSNVVQVPQGGEPPAISSVSPLTGYPDEEVTFTADVAGEPPLTYSWNFGGGADPNISTEESPVVTLAEPGSYDSTLTVVNAFGADTLEFTLEISGLPHIDYVRPRIGAVGSEVTFTATVSGAPADAYEWNFDGGALPDTPTTDVPEVTVMLLMAGGYDPSVTASNSYGSYTYPFHLSVGVPPTVTGVEPTTGVTGTSVQFSADASGNPPLSYSWNFGDGATPSTSGSANPSVILGGVGTYDCSVTVTNDYGEVTYPFTLEVTPIPPTPNIIGVSPTSGLPYSEVTFSATVLGEAPFSFNWNFGGGADPNTSTEDSPLVTLSDAGNYYASLEVTNAYGADTFNFVLGVSFAGLYDETEDNDNLAQANPLPAPPLAGFTGSLGTEGYDGDLVDFFSFTGFSGYTVSVSLNFDSSLANLNLELRDSDGSVLAQSNGSGDSEFIEEELPYSGTYYLRAYRATGGTSDYTLDYDVAEVQPWPSVVVAGSSLSESPVGAYTSLALVGGKPAIAYQVLPGEAGKLKFAANSAADGSGSWTKYDVDTNGDIGYDVSLASVNGKPVISYFFNERDNQEGVKIAVNPQADGSGTWSLLGKIENVSGSPSSVEEVTGTLAIAYRLSSGDIRFAINDQPDGSGSWTRNTVESGDFGDVSLAVVAGYPVVAYVSGDGSTVRVAVNTQADGKGTWNPYTVEQVTGAAFNSVSVSEVDGRPAVAYTRGQGRLLRFAINDSADGSGSWNTVTVGTPSFADAVSLAVVGGLPSIAALNTLDFSLRFVQNSTADGSGTWTVELVDNSGSVGWSCSLAEVAGRPAIAYTDDSNGDLKFARKP